MKRQRPFRITTAKILFIGLSFLAILVFFNSCFKDIKDIENFEFKNAWRPEIAVPLIHAKFAMEDFLSSDALDSVLTVHSDNFISLIYKSGVFHARARDYIIIPNQEYIAGPFKIQVVGQDSIQFPVDFNIGKTLIHNFKFQSEEIKKIIVKNGTLKVKFISSFNKSGYASVNIPAITINGKSFNDTFFFNSDTTYGVTIIEEIDLSGYTINLTENGTTFNKLSADYNVFLEKSDTYVRTYDNARFELILANLEFSYIEGYLGTYTFEFRNDTNDLNLFKNAEAGYIHFENPQLKMNIYNSFGVPIRLINPKIITVSEKYGSNFLTALILNDPLEINYPELFEAGEVKYTGAFMNKTNSNISDIISKTPKHIVYSFDIDANHQGKSYNNFAFDSSEAKVEFEIILPLYGKTGNWVVESEFDYELLSIDFIEAIQFNLFSKNGFPLEAKLQIYFIDSNNVILDSLMHSDEYLISPGKTDYSHRVYETSEKISIIEFDKTKLDNLVGVKKLKARATMSTNNGGKDNVKIFSDYVLELSLSTKVRFVPNEIFNK